MNFPDKIVDICRILNDKEAKDIAICTSKHGLNVVDYFIIASTPDTTSLRNMVDNLIENTNKNMDEFGEPIREGFGLSGWVVLDYDNVFVHMFTEEERAHYSMDKLLNDGKNMTTFKKILNNIEVQNKKDNKVKLKNERNSKSKVEIINERNKMIKAKKEELLQKKNVEKQKRDEENATKKAFQEQMKQEKKEREEFERTIKNQIKLDKKEQKKKNKINENNDNIDSSQKVDENLDKNEGIDEDAII